LADEVLAISQEDLAWLQTLEAAVERSYAAGGATQVDFLRAQNERSKRAELLRNEENSREDAFVQVNRLLNRNVNSAWASLSLPPLMRQLPPTDKLIDYALKFEPRLVKLRKELEGAEAMASQARKEKRPDLGVAVEGRQYSRTGEGRSASVLLKMTVPWVNRGKYNAAIRREESKRQAIEHEIEDMSHEAAAEIHHLVSMIDNARREALLYEEQIIPRTELALRSAEEAWRAGRERFRDVIDTRRMLVEARQMRVRAVAEQQSALYELVLCCGIADLEMIESLLGEERNKQ
jgi:outer membrane protein TolC